MKAIITPNELAKVLKKASPVIKKNTVLPILDCVKLEFEKDKLTVYATDLETTIITTLDCEYKTPFTVVIDYNKLVEICSKIPELITIDASGEQIVITGDTAKFKFAKSFDENMYPNAERSVFDFSMDVDTDFFTALASANSCRSTDNNRDGLNAPCIHVKKDSVTLVGTDALILYKNKLKIETGKEAQVMTPDSFVQIVKYFNDGTVFINDKFIKVETANTTIISLLLEGRFCFYETILPNEIVYNIKINRSEFIRKLSITGVAANLSNHMSVLNFNGCDIKIVSQDIDYGNEAEEILKSSGDAGIDAIGINGNQMLKLLNMLNTEEVEMSFTSPSKSIYLRPAGDPNLLCLVQPLMIN